MNKIGICSDHAGYEVKELVKSLLIARGLEVKDFGCPSPERCDYPDYAHPMGQAIESGELARGISVCGSGNGISMVMNKYSKVRAALCWDVELAKLAREHNDAKSSLSLHASSAKSRSRLSSQLSLIPPLRVVVMKHV